MFGRTHPLLEKYKSQLFRHEPIVSEHGGPVVLVVVVVSTTPWCCWHY